MFEILGIGLIVLCVIYFIVKAMKLQVSLLEGLTTMESSNGEAGTATSYSAAVKAKSVQLQDELLISKYRTDYENIITNMDDFLNLTMLKTILNVDLSDPTKAVAEIGALKVAKDALNDAMKYIDSI